jgi:adenosylmethionine-8-amino-7-oxononanoate aminotransferase
MSKKTKKLDASSNLILHLTAKSDIDQGISVITRGEGVHVWDQDGKKYLDLDSGVTRPVHVGYGRKELAQAAYDQMVAMVYYTPKGYANLPAMGLAERLAKVVPGDIQNFTFDCGGSDAVESAMKLARQYHADCGEKGRYKVISRRGAYHGVNGLGIRALGTVMNMRHAIEPVAPGSVFVESPYCFRCPFKMRYPDCDIHCARDVERIIEFEGPDMISAMITEPFQQNFGAYGPPPEYFPILSEILDQYGILLIIDEVICGFGRTGKMFGMEHFDVKPDIVTMAKGLSSGYSPLGAVGCTDKVIEKMEMFAHLRTYGNHPTSCAVAIKNLEIIQKEKLVENAAAMGDYFLEGLRGMVHHPSVGEVRGTGLWTAIDFTTDKKTRAIMPVVNLISMVNRAKEKGVITKLMGTTLEFAPPLIISKEDVDFALRVLDECITEEERDLGL